MPHYRYIIPFGARQLYIEGNAENNAKLFAAIAELADVFPEVCGHCGCKDLLPRTFGKFGKEIACRACEYRLLINDRKDGGLYLKERAWQPPYQREGAATGVDPTQVDPGPPPDGDEGSGERTLY